MKRLLYWLLENIVLCFAIIGGTWFENESLMRISTFLIITSFCLYSFVGLGVSVFDDVKKTYINGAAKQAKDITPRWLKTGLELCIILWLSYFDHQWLSAAVLVTWIFSEILHEEVKKARAVLEATS
jgi:hypothetical protein